MKCQKVSKIDIEKVGGFQKSKALDELGTIRYIWVAFQNFQPEESE